MSRRNRKHKTSPSPAISNFNREFNARRKSMERWHNVIIKLSEFEGLVNNFDDASPDEIQTLKAIHGKLYECCAMARKQFNDKSIGESLVPTTSGFYEMCNLLGEVNDILKDALTQGVITEGVYKVVRKILALTEEHNRQGYDLTKKFCPLKFVLGKNQ